MGFVWLGAFEMLTGAVMFLKARAAMRLPDVESRRKYLAFAPRIFKDSPMIMKVVGAASIPVGVYCVMIGFGWVG
ncbi:hypothetical protein [Catellatospora sichuanensis]|uniref:hypothetical protein n=1 Tax=Catellatospora sichuanensis TaxID=1969805 RepID=UPI0011822BA6|nr:hypothetical protein [Catellatospora sichuanensis]